MKAKIVALFNHKGGVSKTTTTYNIGWKLAKMGKKVLLVDGDPQCNLSSLLLGANFYTYFEDDNTKHKNIKDAVKVAFEGKPFPIQAIDCFSPSQNQNLFLIPGHMDLAEYEAQLSFALNSGNMLTTLQNLPGSFYELIRKCCEKYDIDYVFVDMNPGLSAINQVFFMMCDGFIVPTNPDPFSLMALSTLEKVLPRWKNWAIQSREYFIDSSYALPEAEMKFMGEIIQRFSLRNGQASNPYTMKINDIKEKIETNLVSTFERNNMLIDITELKDENVLSDYCLGEIPEFGALLQKANKLEIPVFELNETNMGEAGTVLTQMLKKKDVFNELFEKIAAIITRML